MTKAELIHKMNNTAEKIEELDKELRSLECEYAKMEIPLEVGDKVFYKKYMDDDPLPAVVRNYGYNHIRNRDGEKKGEVIIIQPYKKDWSRPRKDMKVKKICEVDLFDDLYRLDSVYKAFPTEEDVFPGAKKQEE